MKTVLVYFFLLIPAFAFLQKIEKFYDYRGNEAMPQNSRYYAAIVNTDSGWNRSEYYIRERSLRIKGLYLDSLCKIPHGWYYAFHANQMVSNFGKYYKGRKDGLWLSYYNNGTLLDSTIYLNGKPTGTWLRWHRNKLLADSTIWNGDGSSATVSWFDNGWVSASGSYNVRYKKRYYWFYYHKNGKTSCREKYEDGQVVERQYFDEAGVALQDTTSTDRKATFKKGAQDWQKYLRTKLTFPEGYRIINGDSAVVVVRAVIDEEGYVQDPEVIIPFHPDFDRIALDALFYSPPWNPAMDHNRRVKFYIKQSFIFIKGKSW